MKKISFLLLSMLMLVSCNDFLDMEPTNSANSAEAIATPTDARVVINGIMRTMASSSYYGRNFFMCTFYGARRIELFRVKCVRKGQRSFFI